LKGVGPIAAMKRRPDVELFELTKNNQDILFEKIISA
jgi:hypothetical protein